MEHKIIHEPTTREEVEAWDEATIDAFIRQEEMGIILSAPLVNKRCLLLVALGLAGREVLPLMSGDR